jgi:hypothetical protein
MQRTAPARSHVRRNGTAALRRARRAVDAVERSRLQRLSAREYDEFRRRLGTVAVDRLPD